MLYVAWKKTSWKICTFCPVSSNKKSGLLISCVFWILLIIDSLIRSFTDRSNQRLINGAGMPEFVADLIIIVSLPGLFRRNFTSYVVPAGTPSRGGDVMVYVTDTKLTKLAHSFLFCSCVCFCLYGPFNSISFHKFSRQLFVFSLCSSGLHSALMVLSTIYLFMKVSLSPDVIPCGLLGLKH